MKPMMSKRACERERERARGLVMGCIVDVHVEDVGRCESSSDDL